MMASTSKMIRPVAIIIFVSLLAFLSIAGLRLSGCLQFLELRLYDQLVAHQNHQQLDPRIVIIGIDEYDIHDEIHGGWPKEDAELADLINRLGQMNPSVIGLDLFRDLPIPKDGSQQAVLSKALLDHPVVAISKLGDAETPLIAPPAAFAEYPERVGINDFPVDFDKMLRRSFLYLDDGLNVYYSLSFQLALSFLQNIESFTIEQDPVNPERLKVGKTWFEPFQGNKGGYIHEDDQGYSFLLDFKGPRAFTRFSWVDVMSGKVTPNDISGRIVLIGAMAESLKDYYPSIFNFRQYGIELHAQALNQILRSALDGARPLRSWSEIQEYLFIFGGCLLGALIGFASGRPLRFFLMASGSLLAIVLATYLSFGKGWWLPALPFALGWLFSIVGTTLYMYTIAGRQKREIRSMFSTMISPSVLEYLQEDPDRFRLTGESKEATMFFSDVAGFTTISEQLSAANLALVLNRYLTPMSDCIIHYGGYIDKYEGDAIMADFGVPVWPGDDPNSHAWKACWSALDQQAKLAELRPVIQEEFHVDLQVRMGVNSGTVAAGNMGSEQKFQYTVMGDAVNQAARFEPANKMFDTLIIIGESTYQHAQEKIEVRPLALLLVKGKTEPIKIYELVAKKGELSDAQKEVLELFAKGWDLYKEKRFEEAIEVFRHTLTLDPSDGPSKAYEASSLEYIQNPPPEDWNGTWIQHSK